MPVMFTLRGGIRVTEDIVARLRNWLNKWDGSLIEEAADEIERLREDRDRWRNTAQDLLKAVRGE